MLDVGPITLSFPRLHAAASLKQPLDGIHSHRRSRFPRLHAAASLKLNVAHHIAVSSRLFSAATCRGLIEAKAAADWRPPGWTVFRGYMPRPH